MFSKITKLLSSFFNKKKILFPFFLLLAMPSLAHTKSDFEVAGDITQILLPISAASATIYLQDYQGLRQFSYAFGSTLVSTYALKYGVNRTRPDGTKYSFPSGHTSAAFSAASFIHFRYGWQKAIPAYLLASYVGYSRVRANRHYKSDVRWCCHRHSFLLSLHILLQTQELAHIATGHRKSFGCQFSL